MNGLKLILHGAAQEVGRSCVEIKDKGMRFFFDAGLKIGAEESHYPKIPKGLGNVGGVFLSHCHLDHSGALPYLYHLGLKSRVFCTSITKDITKILLKDSWKVGRIKHMVPEYEKRDINKILRNFEIINYKEPDYIDGARFEYFDAGHIPGAASPYLEFNGKKILYSGDINTETTRLVDKAKIPVKDVDVFVVETTYGDRDHPERYTQEVGLLDNVQEALDNGGKALIPTFAVGRAQEVLMILADRNFNVPIYLDGMSKRITEDYLAKPEFLRDDELLNRALRKVRFVTGWKERQEIVKEQAIFVTTSGMMDGGPVIDYLTHLWFEENTKILLTGFQTHGTNGRLLLEKGKVKLDKETVKVKCDYKNFDFSSHCGMKELKKLIKQVNPKKLILNHGDPSSIKNLLEWAKQEGFDVAAPEINEVIDIE